MFPKLRSLFLFAFVVHWSTGYGFFLGNRWDSTPSSGPDNSQVQAHNYNAVTQWGRPPTPIPVQAEALLALNEIIPPPAATIPLPIAIQLPQQIEKVVLVVGGSSTLILPLAMYPAVQAPIQAYKSGHRPPTHHNNAIPFVKISQAEPPAPPVPVASPTTIAAVRFVPCFCGNNNNEEKRGYAKTHIQYAATPTGFQPVHLLPCYCPVVREIEPQYVQPSPLPSSTSEPLIRDYSVSTISPK